MTVSEDSAVGTLGRCRALVLPALREAVERLDPWAGRMTAYAFGWTDAAGNAVPGDGGKGMRQALALLTAQALGAPAEAAVPGAVAVELVHGFSLVHDDVMDGDERRRHRDTVWKAYGVGAAVLAGDAMLGLAMDTLANATPGTGPAAVRLLSRALLDLANGQAADLAFEGRPWSGPGAVGVDEYLAMAAGKTGSLLGCAAGLGAVLAGAPSETVAAVTGMGRELGLAFQAVDDLLGIWGDPEVTGKPVHNDLRRRKKTLPVVAALAADRSGRLATLLGAPVPRPAEAAALIREAGGRAFAAERAARHLDAALRILDRVTVDPVAAAELAGLAEFVVARTH
ncbi:polyprenyl synthetase family protein [Microbispora sp. CA-135349]|uniref:polyprenyl synthetase family protein n=1 Tax=Microbispora sp. CA-135349 TaxID=3239953 RepID=UPI003D937481